MIWGDRSGNIPSTCHRRSVLPFLPMKLSESLQDLLAAYTDQPIPVGALVEVAGEQGFGIITGFLVLPMLIPLPVPLPGFSALIGAGVIVLGGQLALNRHRPYLPARIARITFPPAVSRSLLKNLSRLLRPLERLSRPRLFRISHNPTFRRLLGICMIWNALLMSLPLPFPFTNLAPGYTILTQAIAVLESDGIFMLISYGLTALTTVFFASITGAAWALLVRFIDGWRNWE